MFEYQKHNRFFAQAAGGMEELCAAELAELGAVQIKEAYRGVYFQADRAALYRINYRARLISRVLAPLNKFECYSSKNLYKQAKAIKWDSIFSISHTFAIFANVSNSKITHSKYAAQCLKDGVVDYFRSVYRKRPNVDTTDPDVWLNLHIENNNAVISLDTSGGPLHKRGYRKKSVKAPMQETLAAAIMKLTGWEGEQPLYDPMCGSGTLLSEALMHYCRIPAAHFRKRFGFEFLEDFHKNIWESIKKEAEEKLRELPKGLISGSDISMNAVAASKANINNLPFAKAVKLKKMMFQKLESLQNTIIVTNPPYGIRIGQKDQIGELYKVLGDFLKQRCQGSVAYIYFGDRTLIGKIGLKPAWKKPLINGALDGRLVKFEIY